MTIVELIIMLSVYLKTRLYPGAIDIEQQKGARGSEEGNQKITGKMPGKNEAR